MSCALITVSHCGSTLTALRGEITSPNYPGPYPSGRDCTWKILVTPGSHIQLTFRVKTSFFFYIPNTADDINRAKILLNLARIWIFNYDLRSFALLLKQKRKKRLKNSYLGGTRTLTSAIPVQCSSSWRFRPTWSWSLASQQKARRKWIYPRILITWLIYS